MIDPPDGTARDLLKYSGAARRIVAYLVDRIVVAIAGTLALGLFVRGAIALDLYSVAGLVVPHVGPGPVDTVALWTSYSLLEKVRVLLVLIALPRWIYGTLFHGSRFAATPGKMLLGMKVVTSQGQRLGYLRAGLRSLIRGCLAICTLGISEFVSLCLIWAASKRKAIHDLVVGSVVIRTAPKTG